MALVSEAASVLLALSDFLEAASVLFFSLVLLVLVFGDVAAFSVGLVALSAEAAGLFVEAGTVALAEGFVVVVVAGVAVGIGFTEALAEGVMLAAAVAAGVADAETLAVAIGVAAGVALAVVDALVLEVLVAPVVVWPDVVTPTLKLGVTP